MNNGPRGRLLFEDETFQVRSAIFEVNREFGAGFLEAVDQERPALEFSARGIPFSALKPLHLACKGHTLGQVYKPDFIFPPAPATVA